MSSSVSTKDASVCARVGERVPTVDDGDDDDGFSGGVGDVRRRRRGVVESIGLCAHYLAN